VSPRIVEMYTRIAIDAMSRLHASARRAVVEATCTREEIAEILAEIDSRTEQRAA
jgi:hypothetical protein